MATTIQYPTFTGISYFNDGDVYLKGDNASINKFCADRGKTLVSYELEEQRFSNDGALAYQYYGTFTGALSPGVTGTTTKWQMEWGYSKIVKSLTVTP
jgi:hypothetical protein